MLYLTKEDDIAVLNLSVRATNCLRRAGMHTVGALIEYPSEQFAAIRNIGIKTVEEIQTILAEIKNGSERFLLVSADMLIEETETLNPSNSNALVTVFKDDFGVVEGDISIEKLAIPLRAKNCLINAGYTCFSQLVGLTFEEMMKIKNMGQKTATELLTFIGEHQVSFEVQENDSTERSSLNELAKELNVCWSGNINMWLREIVAIKKDFPEDNNDAFLFKLYDCEFARSTIKQFVLSSLNHSEDGISRTKLFELVPSHLYNTIALEAILLEMESSSQITIDNQVISIRYMSVNEFLKTIPNERHRKIIQMRMQGQSLQQIGETMSLTRERVRQLIIKPLKQRPRLREDKYAYIFKNYYFSEEDFCRAFGEGVETYNYLETVYPTTIASRKSMNEILSDLSVPLALRKASEKVIYKDYIIVDNIRLRKQRQVLVKYFIKTQCKEVTEYDHFYEQYHLWLDSLEIADGSSLYIDSRTYENHVSLSKYVLWNQGRCFRYYNISDYDYTELLSVINLEQFENIELSSLKFFREYPELMYQYDIHDEYELHNLLKKIWPEEKDFVFFKKMPTIEIGVGNRDKQLLDLLMQCAPISNEDFAAKYEEIYGVKAATVLANYLDSLDIYLYDGIYSIDSKELPSAEADRMKELLADNFYTISEVKNLYIQNFPSSDVSNINPYTLKKLGFLVYAGNNGYIVRNCYSSSSDYFNDILTKSDIVDMRTKNSTLCYIGAYQAELYALKDNYEIVEFSPLQYINIRRLCALGITKEDVRNYCYTVASFVKFGDYFTIKSIRQDGFVHAMDTLGFDDWFYSSLLTINRDLFSHQRIGGTRVMSKGKNVVTLSKFLENILKENGETSIVDLLNILTNRFGANFSKERLVEFIREADFDYDSALGTVSNI